MTDIFFDANLVKVRGDRFSACTVTLHNACLPCKVGDFVFSNSLTVAGIAISDSGDGDTAVVVYQADKIVLPFVHDTEKGEPLAIKLDIEDGTIIRWCLSAPKYAGVFFDNMTTGSNILYATALESKDVGDTCDEILCDLWGYIQTTPEE